MVVDSDVEEFPACTLATAIARAATSDAVADAVEAAEFFDVEMDDFAGPLALVARGGFLRLEAGEPAEPRRSRMRETLALEIPSSVAMCSWVRRSRRKLSTASHVAGWIWTADERGLEDRSRKPPTPSARKRSTHLPTVFGVVLNWRAAAALVIPRSTTPRTISSRPFGVRRAFLWVSLRSSANRWGLATSAFTVQAEWTTSWKFTANPPDGLPHRDRRHRGARAALNLERLHH